ncbi:MAG: arsenate reductase ArsC [Nitrospirae bacterium]|nr:arsenate reductase ArsC [Candidatus Manganitrophaceae bacterium]
MKKENILILCTGTAARSQMAEAYFKKFIGERVNILSAGLEPQEVHPLAKAVMKEDGINIDDQRSKGVEQFLGKLAFRHVIIVCEKAEKNCPRIFPGAMNRLFWPFEDPRVYKGSDNEKLEKFREIRDQIKARIQEFVQGQIYYHKAGNACLLYRYSEIG